MVSLSSLITPLTKDGVIATLLTLLASRGFPATSWAATSVPRAFVEVFAIALADLSATIANLARSAFLSTASGGWLDLIASEFFGITRRPAVATIGTIKLQDRGGGPNTLLEGEVWIKDSAGRRFKFIFPSPTTLALNSDARVSFEAEEPGSAYNIPNNSTLTLVTTLPTVDVSNPPVGTTSTWIAVQGRDAETDEGLRQRCRERWSSIGAGVAAAYRWFCKQASDSVTRVSVHEHTPAGGHVTCYIAGDDGALSSSIVADVLAYLMDGRRPQCITVHVYSCTNVSMEVGGTIIVKSSRRASAETAIAAAIREYEKAIDIGGSVSIAELIERVMSVDGVINFAPTRLDGSNLPATPFLHDVALSTGQVARLSVASSMTYVEV